MFKWSAYQKLVSIFCTNLDFAAILSNLNISKKNYIILGHKLSIIQKDSNKKQKEVTSLLNSFKLHMKTFTYVDKFEYKNKSTSDVNWGCTIRSGQMLFCNLLIFKFGLDLKNPEFSKTIYGLFIDKGPFSIQNLLTKAEHANRVKFADQWRPSDFCLSLQEIVNELQTTNDINKIGINKSFSILIFDSQIKMKQIVDKLETVDYLVLVVHFP